ncbi:MAG TPA: DNA repair protein RecO [Rhabdochlamydiaceae bacterium]|nr:DNA repair protein RecO [Rhabdochlamydiaceae bacterium]
MHDEHTEGIVLKSILYKDHDRIVTLMTLEAGLISILAKRVKTPEKMTLLSPFSQIELIYQRKKSDLYTFKDGSLLSDHLKLREKWDYLDIAGKMGNLILTTQLPGKPAPLLYTLFIACLKQLPYFEDPMTLLLLFHLKLLTHEGMLSWEIPGPLPPQHWEVLKELALSRSFKSVQKKRGLGPLYALIQKT